MKTYRTQNRWAHWAMMGVVMCGMWMNASLAYAMCGMFVPQSPNDTTMSLDESDLLFKPLINDATHVVLYRDDLTTQVTMQNSYQGPTEDFAMIVPVPEVLEQHNVQVLSTRIMKRLARLTAPSQEHYHMGMTCDVSNESALLGLMSSTGAGKSSMDEAMTPSISGVHVAAAFDVGEYAFKVLDATDSAGLMAWLEQEHYVLPEGAESILQGYIAAGMYFFVAKIHADRVNFDRTGRAMLSPIRFSYTSQDFSLPMRLGMINVDKTQDMMIHIISPEGRFETSNYTTGTIPSGFVVKSKQADDFDRFYASLREQALKAQNATLITEFAATASLLPCPSCTPQQVLNQPSILYPFVHRGESEVTTHYELSTVAYDDEGKGGRLISALRKKAKQNIQKHCVDDEMFSTIRKASTNGVQWAHVRFGAASIGMSVELGETVGFNGVDEETFKTYKTCIEQALNLLAFDEAFKGFHDQTIHLKFIHQIDREMFVPAEFTKTASTMTVTRLRGSFSPSGTQEDLIFKLAKPLSGGFAHFSDDGTVHANTTSLAEDQTSAFAARYYVVTSSAREDVQRCDMPRYAEAYWEFESVEWASDTSERLSKKSLRAHVDRKRGRRFSLKK